MMKILFIVQGEGRGHMTQAITLSRILQKHGYTIVQTLIGTSKRRTIPDYFYKQMQTPVTSYESPNFVRGQQNKRIKRFASIIYNLSHIGRIINSLRFIRKKIKDTRPDVVVNFYEMMSGLYFFFYRPDVKHYCIGHQYMIFHPEFEIPSNKPVDAFLLKLHTRLTSLRADKIIGLSFNTYKHLPDQKLYVLPPLLRRELLDQQPTDAGYILGYILNSGYAAEIEEWHKNHGDVEVHFFGDLPQGTEQMKLHDRLVWHAIDDRKFLHFLVHCSALVTSAGFEAVCEAMYLNKPVMMVPTGNHFEQECNALDAAKSGAGIVSEQFDLNRLIRFIPHYNHHHLQYRKWVHSAEHRFLSLFQ